MTKKVFGTIAIVAAVFAGYSTQNTLHEKDLNDFAITNITALASGERPDGYLIVEKDTVEIWDEKTQTNKKMITINCDGIGSEKCE